MSHVLPGIQTAYNPQPSGLQNAHPHQHLQNSVAMANAAYAQNQAAFQHQQMMMHQYNQARKPKPFKIHGKEMDLIEFVETLYPEDCPERTYLLLKLKGNENE